MQSDKKFLLNSKIEEWMKIDRNEKNRDEVHELVVAGNVEELEKRFLHRIQFSTAGLRGRMTAGFSMMNDVVVIQTAQGLCSYLMETQSDIKTAGIAVGFDGRHNSQKWAHFTAAAALRHGIPVYLFSAVVPTPYVAFAVRHLKAGCGVMVTASHNPKQDNGYKVYWSNGAQIVTPHDKNIQESILKNQEMDDVSWDISVIQSNPKVSDPTADIDKSYYEQLAEYVQYKERNSSSDLRVVYTAMHGVGWRFIQKSIETFGFKPCVPVKEQIDPDPEFSTVTFPNPEEGKSALNLAFQTAKENDINFILANDPDADRLAAAEKNLKSGEWKVFNGNEMGALLGWWCWHCYKLKNPQASGESVYMMASTVSSKILQSIAEVEQFHFIETLTGFKWMGNKAAELESQGKTVILAFEEAIGFMCGTLNYDKDGVSALGVFYEMAAYLQREGKQLHQQLDVIYDKYGHHVSNNSYYICHDQQIIKSMFDRIRCFDNAPNTYPKEIGGVEVRYVRDLTTGYDNKQADCKAVLPVSASSQMITFTFNNNAILTLRTSGTEPKIKYYSEIRAKGVSREELELSLNNLVNSAVELLLEPKKNGLQDRPTS